MAGEGPIVFAFDGSESARQAIALASDGLSLQALDRPAIVLTVWEPVAAVPFGGVAVVSHVDVDAAIEKEATRTAEEGADLARQAGFAATPRVVCAAPVWKGVVDFCEEEKAVVAVLGSRGLSGVRSVLLGSVATAVARHSGTSVLIAR